MYDCYLMHIQHQSWKVAHSKDQHYEHQDYRHAVFSSPTSPPSSSDGNIDLGIEETDSNKWNQTHDNQSGPVYVPGYVHLIHPEIISS